MEYKYLRNNFSSAALCPRVICENPVTGDEFAVIFAPGHKSIDRVVKNYSRVLAEAQVSALPEVTDPQQRLGVLRAIRDGIASMSAGSVALVDARSSAYSTVLAEIDRLAPPPAAPPSQWEFVSGTNPALITFTDITFKDTATGKVGKVFYSKYWHQLIGWTTDSGASQAHNDKFGVRSEVLSLLAAVVACDSHQVATDIRLLAQDALRAEAQRMPHEDQPETWTWKDTSEYVAYAGGYARSIELIATPSGKKVAVLAWPNGEVRVIPLVHQNESARTVGIACGTDPNYLQQVLYAPAVRKKIIEVAANRATVGKNTKEILLRAAAALGTDEKMNAKTVPSSNIIYDANKEAYAECYCLGKNEDGSAGADYRSVLIYEKKNGRLLRQYYFPHPGNHHDHRQVDFTVTTAPAAFVIDAHEDEIDFNYGGLHIDFDDLKHRSPLFCTKEEFDEWRTEDAAQHVVRHELLLRGKIATVKFHFQDGDYAELHLADCTDLQVLRATLREEFEATPGVEKAVVDYLVAHPDILKKENFKKEQMPTPAPVLSVTHVEPYVHHWGVKMWCSDGKWTHIQEEELTDPYNKHDWSLDNQGLERAEACRIYLEKYPLTFKQFMKKVEVSSSSPSKDNEDMTPSDKTKPSIKDTVVKTASNAATAFKTDFKEAAFRSLCQTAAQAGRHGLIKIIDANIKDPAEKAIWVSRMETPAGLAATSYIGGMILPNLPIEAKKELLERVGAELRVQGMQEMMMFVGLLVMQQGMAYFVTPELEGALKMYNLAEAASTPDPVAAAVNEAEKSGV